MKSKRLTIQIRKSVKAVVSFVLNPKNTPLWIDSISKEETNELPVKVGTIYRNLNKDGIWNEYTLTDLNENRFTMVQKDGNYHVQYTFSQKDKGFTKFEYYEWVNKGDLFKPFTIDILQKLKKVVEHSNYQ